MPINSERYLTDYANWLASAQHCPEVGKTLDINSPCLDRHCDYIELFCRQPTPGLFTICDDSYTLDDLELSGCPLTQPRKFMLDYIMGRAGISVESSGNLSVSCTEDELAQKKHDLMQAVLTINDVFYSHEAATCFNSLIAKWLVEKNVPFVSHYMVEGVSGLNNFFDFIIPASANAGERFIFLTNCVSETAINNIIYLWRDIAATRDPGCVCYVVVNDENSFYLDKYSGYVASLDYEDALAAHQIKIIPWSRREAHLPALLE